MTILRSTQGSKRSLPGLGVGFEGLGIPYAYWLKTQLFNFWASYKVVYSESFNFYFLGFWPSRYVLIADIRLQELAVQGSPYGLASGSGCACGAF